MGPVKINKARQVRNPQHILGLQTATRKIVSQSIDFRN